MINNYFYPLIPFLIIVPFTDQKVMCLAFAILYHYFLPDYWQLWFILFTVSLITSRATKA
jgi:hypothetical protein